LHGLTRWLVKKVRISLADKFEPSEGLQEGQ